MNAIKIALLGATSLFVPPIGVIMMDAPQLADLEARVLEITASVDAFRVRAEAGEELTDEETDQIEQEADELEKINKKIKALKLLAPQGQGRRTAPENRTEPTGHGRGQRVPATAKDTARHGFTNVGEFAMSVRGHKLGDFESEGVKKLMAAATTFGSEGVGTDGGFTVPPDFSTAIWKKVEAEENLMSRCAELTPAGNSMSIPKDETTPWGSAGLQVYWESEGAQMTGTKGVLENSTFRLFKLTALSAASEELLEDSQGYESWIMAKVPGIMSHKINTAIISGTGAGQPLGVLKAPSLISVAKETSQPADSIWKANIDKMWSRMYAPWRRNAVWIINQDAEPALEAMGYSPSGVVPTAASMPVYLPPGGVADAPYARLKGRPVIPLQAAKTVGDQGDIMLVDFQQYWILRKAAGLRTDTSMHLYFDQALMAFRWIFRINGQPAWSAAVTPENSSNTLSWAVTLDAR